MTTESKASTRVLPAEVIAATAGGSTPYLRPPEAPTLFALTAIRLEQHAARGHSMAEFLRFCAVLARAQHALMQTHEPPALPGLAQIRRATEHGMPPLPASDGPLSPQWRELLPALLAEVRDRLPGPAGAVADAVAAMPAEALDRQADALLNGVTAGLDLAASPFVAAALQLHFAQAAVALLSSGWQAPAAGLDTQFTCPCCGTLPLASITRFGGAVTGQRYLHCALCHTEWHLLRGVCAHCGQREGLSWRSLQGLEADSDGADSDEAAQDGQAAVQGEACDACGHYLKLLHGDRDAQLDPVADDLATLTLDLLLGDEGLQRHGANLMLLFGEGEAAHDDPPSSSGSG